MSFRFTSTARDRILRRLAFLVPCLILGEAPVVVAHPGHAERTAQLLAEVAANPEAPAPHLALAEENIRHGDGGAALLNLARVEALAPGRFLTDLLRARALLVGGNGVAARRLLDRFLAQHPENLGAVVLRGRVLLGLGETEAGLADFRTALAPPALPDPDLVREAADALAAAGRTTEALTTLDAGMARIGRAPSLVLRALELECEAGQFDAALTRVHAAQRDAPRPEPWMAQRASVLASAGRIGESRTAWHALREHLAALPLQDRGAHAMSTLLERTLRALAALDSISRQ